MQRLEVSGAVRPIYGSLGVKGLKQLCSLVMFGICCHLCTMAFLLGGSDDDS